MNDPTPTRNTRPSNINSNVERFPPSTNKHENTIMEINHERKRKGFNILSEYL